MRRLYKVKRGYSSRHLSSAEGARMLRCFTGREMGFNDRCHLGIFQSPNHPDDMDKTAFVCDKGLFAFRVLPMGLRNSPATYQRLMVHIMSPLLYETCLFYLDDCIVYSRTFEKHFQCLDEVLNRMEKSHLRYLPKLSSI